MLALVPRPVDAAPILAGVSSVPCPALSPDGSTGIVPATTLSCGFANLGDALGGPLTLSGDFTADEDVALFQFVLTTTAFVSASATDNTGSEFDPFDPLIGLFNAATGDIVRYFDPELGDDTDAENDDSGGTLNALIPTIQLEAGTYILALLQAGNSFSSGDTGIDSLRLGFAWDSADPGSLPGRCTVGGISCAFNVGLTATAPSASVPEPGTLSLLAMGAAAAAFARRRRALRR
jgi:hypothetical protein